MSSVISTITSDRARSTTVVKEKCQPRRRSMGLLQNEWSSESALDVSSRRRRWSPLRSSTTTMVITGSGQQRRRKQQDPPGYCFSQSSEPRLSPTAKFQRTADTKIILWTLEASEMPLDVTIDEKSSHFSSLPSHPPVFQSQRSNPVITSRSNATTTTSTKGILSNSTAVTQDDCCGTSGRPTLDLFQRASSSPSLFSFMSSRSTTTETSSDQIVMTPPRRRGGRRRSQMSSAMEPDELTSSSRSDYYYDSPLAIDRWSAQSTPSSRMAPKEMVKNHPTGLLSMDLHPYDDSSPRSVLEKRSPSRSRNRGSTQHGSRSPKPTTRSRDMTAEPPTSSRLRRLRSLSLPTG